MPLKVVTTVQGTVAAAVVKGALEQAGIPAMVRGAGHGTWLFPGAAGGLGPVDVMVSEEHLAEAEEVLAELEAEAGA